MTDKTIDYYLTINSPWSYMGAGRLIEMAGKYDCHVNVYPTQHGFVFDKTGGLPLNLRAPERIAYRQVELARWRDFLDLPMNIKPAHFPVEDANPSHAIIAAMEVGKDALALSYEIGRAQWEMEENISLLSTIEKACDRAGINFEALGDVSIRASQFKANSERAVERGVFGYPTYIYRDELFWGQDRLDFLERVILA